MSRFLGDFFEAIMIYDNNYSDFLDFRFTKVKICGIIRMPNQLNIAK